MVREDNEGNITCDEPQGENGVGSGTEEVEDGQRQNLCKDVSFISLR